MFSLIALPPLLIIGLTTLLSLAFAHTTCRHVLAVNGLLCRPLVHLSALSYHMLGYGDLDLLSGSPRFLLMFLPLRGFLPQMTLVDVGWKIRCSCNSWLSPVCSDSVPYGFLAVAYWTRLAYSCLWIEFFRLLSLVVAQVRNVVFALDLDVG